MNYYTKEDGFHVSAKDRIAAQWKVQNFANWKYKGMSYIFHFILAQFFICQNASGLLLVFISFTDRTVSQSVTAAIVFKSISSF